MIDIVELKKLINNGTFTVWVRQGQVYLENDAGESILICNLDKVERRSYVGTVTVIESKQ